MPSHADLLKRLYDRLNARDMEALLVAMHPDVLWANGMEGGHVRGREAVRSYWTRQWAMLNPQVDPISFCARPNGSTRAEVTRSCAQGAILLDRTVGHIFHIEQDLITRFDIEEFASSPPRL